MLGVNDLKQVIERLIGQQNRLPENDIKFLIQVCVKLIPKVIFTIANYCVIYRTF